MTKRLDKFFVPLTKILNIQIVICYWWLSSSYELFDFLKWTTGINTTSRENDKVERIILTGLYIFVSRGHYGHDHMVVGFTTTCAISAYHH
jgi:hypothetical protein